jgi:PAS domain S-box-containing protein
MIMETVKILLVEDNPPDVMRVKEALHSEKKVSFQISVAESLDEARQAVEQEQFQLILLDLGLPDSQGLDTFCGMRDLAPDIPIVVLSGLDDEDIAVEAMSKGGQDYISKDSWDSRTIIRSLNYSLERHKILAQWQHAEKQARESESRFKAVFDESEDWIFLKGPDLKFVQVNPAMAKDLGRDASELVGLTNEEIFGAEAAQSLSDIDRRALKGQSVEVEHTLQVGGIDIVWSFSISPLKDADGAISGIFGIARDVTGRKKPDPAAQSADEYASRAMRSTLFSARRVAPSSSTVLLLGESGAGKDYLAKYIHDHSNRAHGPYFSVNCAAITSSLAESELFGHEKGAFTGAGARKRGMLELAEGGTLLLNEVGDLPLPLQAKLLTFFDSRKFTRVGGEKEISVNARIVAATNRDLEKAVEEGTFRQDLLYRISVFRIKVPALRERIEDIPVLAQSILARLAEDMQLKFVPPLTGATLKALSNYRWPGNVRELKNVLERALIVSEGKRLEVELPCSLDSRAAQKGVAGGDFAGRTLREVTDEITRAMCVHALEECNGNKKQAAKVLGIARDSFYRYLKQFDILATNGD